MNSRMRVLGVAVAVTAVSALVLSGGSPGVPIEWHAPTAAAGSAANGAVSPAPQASTRPVGASKPPKGAVPSQTALQELKRTSSSVVLSPQGAVTSVSGTKLATGGPDAFVHRYAAVFGLSDAHGLARVSAQTLAGGDTVTRYAQTAGGLPVLGGQIVVTSRGTTVRSALATTSLMPSAGRATVTAAAAGPIAVAAAADKLKLTGLRVTAAQQWQYDPSVIGAPGSAVLRPAWQVELADADGGDAASVLVDAIDGAVRLTLSTREEARNRLICDLNSTRVDLNVRSAYACTPGSTLGNQASTRSEGQAPSSVAEVNKAYDLLGAVYDFYRSNFGVDSYDDRGAPIRATVRACDLFYSGYQTCNPYPNAFWEGTQFVFGDGYAVDDVVAHEFTHAYTEYSSHLLYAYQSGAINEAISDIMGELFDQSYTAPGETEQPWLMGEDLPGGAIRSMSNPNAHGQPSTVGGAYWDRTEYDNGGVHTNSGVANYAAYKIATQLGNAKSLQLWWRTMHLLPSGADYWTLGSALVSACKQLVGFHGFVDADCWTVTLAAYDTAMTRLGEYRIGVDRYRPCGGRSTDDLYSDDFEIPGTWKMTPKYAINVPSSVAQYQFANTGRGSLNLWTTMTAGGGATATMPTKVVVPDTGAQVSFAFGTLTPHPVAEPFLQISVNGGAWYSYGGNTAGSLQTTIPGYTTWKIDIGSAYKGASVQFRFLLVMRGTSSARYTESDFYVDDFRIYQCSNRPPAPTGYAYINGTTATIGGLASEDDYNTLSILSYELKYIPPIPGAPTQVQPNTVITLPNVGHGPYLVSVRAIDNTGNRGDWALLRMADTPPPNCQKPAYPVGWTMGRRPDACDIVRAPR
jgi:bacillolysin